LRLRVHSISIPLTEQGAGVGTMRGMAMVASHPAGWAILLVLLATLGVGVLVYAVFFR
jgi:hypothetical protein